MKKVKTLISQAKRDSFRRRAVCCLLSVVCSPFSVVCCMTQGAATYTLDAVSGWLTVTSPGELDISALSPRPTVIEVIEGVTPKNVTATYKGVGKGTLLNPQGGNLTGGTYIDQNHMDRYVWVANLDAGTYTLDAASGLGTLCFPNNVELPDGFRAFKAVSVADEVLVLEETTDDYDRIPAYTPVILYKKGGGDIPLGNTGIVSQAPVVIQQSDNLLVGINNTMTVQPETDRKHYLMQNHDGVVGFYTTIDTEGNQRSFTATRYRCFLNLPASASAKALQFSIPERNPSGVNSVQAPASSADGFYSLDGKPVSHPVCGQVYLMRLDGRAAKVIIR